MKPLAWVCWLASIASVWSASAATMGSPPREAALAAYNQGNFMDAYEDYRRLTLDRQADPTLVGADLNMAVLCLQRLGRVQDIDGLLEDAVRAHQGNWRLLSNAAQNYARIPHQGLIVAGEFRRGDHRGDGKVVSAVDRDRARALQLMVQAMPLALADEHRDEASAFFLTLANLWQDNRGVQSSWRLQSLTDLKRLPDYEESFGFFRSGSAAPVDADGAPVFYAVPKSFDAAVNDGQRWRWCLQQATELDPAKTDAVRMQFAEFLWNQFGVQTMASLGWRTDSSRQDESGVYAVSTLKDTETIARLATGVRRFALPDEFNFIKIFRSVADDPKSPCAIDALERLARIFENRRQYVEAAGYWRRLLDQYPDQRANRRLGWQRRLDQIVGNWGRFEPTEAQPAGRGATVDYRFRNGQSVDFSAHEINVEKLLGDVKAFLKSNPRSLDWQRIDISNIGYRLVVQNQRQYVGRQAAQWQMKLEPREGHFDRRVTVTTPLSRPGAYLVEARMSDGNTSAIVLWVNDTAIVKKPLENKVLYYLADAVTGEPIAKANVEFFGWRQNFLDQPPRREVVTRQFAERTDANGQVIPDPKQHDAACQWLVTARTPGGRLAYMGFSNVWFGDWYESQYNAVKVYAITDRPVYRPDQKVQYKLWVRRARYDSADDSEFADRPLTVKVFDAKGEEIASERLQSDRYGGVSGQFAIAADASLGEYQIQCRNEQADILGGGGFRVEEYKKPEYEVTVDAPAKPVALGGTITATIRAKYYFGAPVTNAKVKYKVQRTPHTERWYPCGPWDWLYGPGYGWFGCDYTWYPGWASWGCPRPAPFWRPFRPEPPELVAEQETDIGPDGTVRVSIDTATAKLLHPDQDQSYTITAEVVDPSRRTIVGTGTVLVARRPFSVYAWLDRGYYRTGDSVVARFTARTLDGKPVQRDGEATLLRITYKDGSPVETPVQRWPLATDQNGEARQPFSASQAGQYRIVYRLAASLAGDSDRPAAKDDLIEGGYVFTVRGEGFADGSQFRFNHLELVPDRRQYAPGDKVRLQINVDRAGGTVLLFVRPSNGVYLPPKLLRMEGKSTIEEIAVAQKDMPNFFVEAVTVSDGRVYVETKEIVVPPESRVTTVAVESSKEAYKPGEKAGVKIRLTDLAGKPVTGSTVVAIYDKSVEYISGGSNVPDIREFFWKWRRQHHPTTENNLQRWFQNLVPPKTVGMGNLGVFGGSVADDQSQRRLGEFDVQLGVGVNATAGLVREEAMPMSAPSMSAMDTMAGGMRMKSARAAKLMAPAAAEPVLRTKFADTALWVGSLSTDADGTAHVGLDMPENLTTWRIKVWSMSQGTRVGQGQADVVTRKDLMIRMEAPRFFVQTDEVVLSAIVHNYLKTKQSVQVSLALGDRSGGPKASSPLTLVDPQKAIRTVEIEPGREARVDWPVRVLDEGEAVLQMQAVADEESDAMEQRFPCYVHGMFKTESFSESIRPGDQRGHFSFTVPKDRRPEHSRLEVRWSPSLAAAMVDALPYLAGYPYGCTEQTLNRFLPTVITQKTLLDMKLDLKEIERKRTNLDAQQTGDGRQRAKRWGGSLPTAKKLERNPVFDQQEVVRMVKHGVERLGAMQCADGGWGWFSGFGEHSSPHTTALVVHGLQVAQQNDVALTPGLLERGVEWLKHYQDEQIQRLKNAAVKDKPEDLRWKPTADNLDAMVFMTLVDADVKNGEMLEFLYRDRSNLAVYGLAMFGVALERQGDRDKLAMVLRNIGQFVEQDDENQTAWLRTPQDAWWCWYGSSLEADAYYLKLLARTDPKGELARRLVKYLLNNRKNATYWTSTRDTSLCIEAMAEFVRASGETRPSMTVEVRYDGKLQKTVEITEKNLFDFDNRFSLTGDSLTTGRHTVELRKQGDGPLYCNGYLTNFTLEEFIRKAGLEIKVDRKYYKLVKADKTVEVAGARGQSIDQKVEKYERRPLPSGSEVRSGDLIEIELVIDSKNDYEYLVFEDMKPAGFEPVDVRSGYTGNDLGAYVEFRDNRVAFFVERLTRGQHSVSYRMRAEIPGRFSALPTRASAMYAPELKGNSDEMKVEVEE